MGGLHSRQDARPLQHRTLTCVLCCALTRSSADYITDPMLFSWEDDLRAGRELNTASVAQFEARNPAHRRAMEDLGRSGASGSFGGGSSWGGGGRGASW